jgi:branched-chain amino acid transport system ATP-binding protein
MLSPAEVVTVIGTNGSGKSTLLKAIAGVVLVRSGQVLYQGSDVTNTETYKLCRKGIGFLMQGGRIFPNMSVNEHLRLSAEASHVKKTVAETQKVLELFPPLAMLPNKRAGLLSGGERQMLAFSMLLMQDAKVWLLDEPCSGLSDHAAKNVANLIRDLCKRQEISVLLVEQNLEQGFRIADRICVLKNGLVYDEKLPNEKLSNRQMEEIFF